MIKRLHQYGSALRVALITVSALVLIITATSSMSTDAWADGPRTSRPNASRAPNKAPAKAATKASTTKKRFAAKPVFGVVNINTASAKELEKLPGIGPSKAERIVQYRAKRGPFRRVRDLRRVKGIGRKTVQRMSKHLAVKGATTIRTTARGAGR